MSDQLNKVLEQLKLEEAKASLVEARTRGVEARLRGEKARIELEKVLKGTSSPRAKSTSGRNTKK